MRKPRRPRPIATETAVRRTGSRPRGPETGSGGVSAPGSRMLGRLQDLDDAERAGAAGERLGAGEDALGEVRGGERQRLGPGRYLERLRAEARDRDDPAAGRVPSGRVEGIVVKGDAALLEPALVGEHPLPPDHDHLRRLLRMEPAEM